MPTIKPRVLYLRRSDICGPIELCVGMGNGDVTVYEINPDWLLNIIIDGNKMLYRHLDPMWTKEFEWPERINGVQKDGLKATGE